MAMNSVSKKIKIFFALAFSVLLLTLSACSAQERSTVKVTTVALTETTVTGELSALKYQFLQWQTTGIVQKVLPIGSYVEQNEIIASLDEQTVDQSMKQSLSEKAEIETLIAERDEKHPLHLESANAAVRYFRKKAESAETTYRNLGSPRLSEEEATNLQKNLADAKVKVDKRYNTYLSYVASQEGPKKIQDAKLEWQQAKANYEQLSDLWDDHMGAPSDSEIVGARQVLEDARSHLDYAIQIRDNIKAGDHRILFRYNQGYNSYDFYSNYVFYSSDKWNPVHNTLDEQLKAKKLVTDDMYQIAPFAGDVMYVNTQIGESVEVNGISVGVIDRDSLIVRVRVPEQIVPYLQVGDKATMLPSSDIAEFLTGEILKIQPVSQTVVEGMTFAQENGELGVDVEHSKVFEVLISVDQKEIALLLGTQVDVQFQLSSPIQALSVPETAIMRDELGEFVMVVNSILDEYKVYIHRGNLTVGQQVIYPLQEGVLVAGDNVIDNPIVPQSAR